MQSAALIAGLLAVLLTASDAAATAPITLANLHFLPPARAEGQVAGSGLAWAILVFSESGNASATARFPQAVTAEQFEDTVVGYTNSAGNEDQFAIPGPTTTRELNPFATDLAFPGRVGSLYVEAPNITLELRDVAAEVQPMEGCLRGTVGIPVYHGWAARYDQLCPAASAGVLVPPSSTGFGFRLKATGVTAVEWHGANVSCSGINQSDCPDGGRHDDNTAAVPGGVFLNRKFLGYNRMTTADGFLDAAGSSLLVVAGGAAPSVAIDGSLRMPIAGASPNCNGCMAPDGQTLAVGGHSDLRSLQITSDGQMRADLEGDFTSARLDEQAVDPAFFTSPAGLAVVATAAAGGLIAVGKWLLWPLFTRHKEEDPLVNERRRRLYECIVANPGIHFREALRRAEIPSGSGRHHVTKLVQAGMIIERRHRSSVCLFENNARFRDSWHDLAALRNPDLRLLHEWVSKNPATSQKDIMAAFQSSHGWTRTITQERLQRLVHDGVLDCHVQGRFKLYSAARPPSSFPFAEVQVAHAAPT